MTVILKHCGGLDFSMIFVSSYVIKLKVPEDKMVRKLFDLPEGKCYIANVVRVHMKRVLMSQAFLLPVLEHQHNGIP